MSLFRLLFCVIGLCTSAIRFVKSISIDQLLLGSCFIELLLLLEMWVLQVLDIWSTSSVCSQELFLGSWYAHFQSCLYYTEQTQSFKSFFLWKSLCFHYVLRIIFCQSSFQPALSAIFYLRYDDETEWKMSSDISQGIYTVMLWTSQYSSPIHSLCILTISSIHLFATYAVHWVAVLLSHLKWYDIYFSGLLFCFFFQNWLQLILNPECMSNSDYFNAHYKEFVNSKFHSQSICCE